MAQTALCSATVDPLILLLWLRAQGETWGLCSWQVEATQLLTLLVHCSKTNQRCSVKSPKVENRSEMEVRSAEEIWGSTSGAQGTIVLFLLQPLLKATVTLQDDFRSLSSRTRKKCWPQCCMHLIQVGFGVVPGWFHSSPATRPGLFWWTKAKNTRSSTVNSLGELQLARS